MVYYSMGIIEVLSNLQRRLGTQKSEVAAVISDPHRRALTATHTLPSLEEPMPLFPAVYETLNALHSALSALPLTVEGIPPFTASLRGRNSELVELSCYHESHAEGYVQKLIFTQEGRPVTIYYLTRHMGGELQMLVRYNHNETGVLEPMPEHCEAFAQVIPPSTTLETHMKYGLAVDTSGAVRDPQASVNYGFKNKEGIINNTNVHMLPVPTDEFTSPAPFIDYIVGQISAAAAAIPTSA